MENTFARLIIRSLLDRLEADAVSEHPRFAGVVSALERDALSTLLTLAGVPSVAAADESTQSDVPQVRTNEGDEKYDWQFTPAESREHALDVNQGSTSTPEPKLDGLLREETASETEPIKEPKNGPIHIGTTFKLDETALSLSAPQDTDYVVCVDFGTAKSKAAAARGDNDDNPDLLDLGLGRRDNDVDASVYTVNSSVWITDEGLMFAGSDALRHSIDLLIGDQPRRRLDSIKHQLSLANVQQRLDLRRLELDINPTSVELTYEDALCFFLAFLTDLVGDELAVHGHSRYMRRRFTIPSWRPDQRSWASSTLSTCMGRAQLLADTFRGRWKSGIPVADFKAAATAAKQHDSRLRYLLDGAHGNGQFPGGLLEPLAVGSGRVWADRAARNLVLVVDVGAGTTDFSLFWVVQNELRRKAFPIAPCSDAVRMAGDIVDELLLKQILSRAPGESNDAMRKRMEADLRQRSVRRLKERLFESGRVDVRMVTDHVVTIERDEFESLQQYQAIEAAIERAITEFLAQVSETWGKAAERATLVLTGGSSKLPMIQQLAKKVWKIGGQTVLLDQARQVPKFIEDTFDLDFQREYSQLAVAIGGALPVLDENDVLTTWQGGSRDPGRLEAYRIKGV